MPLFTRVLKRVLFRPASRHPRLQTLWSRVHTLALFGMNYGGGGAIETSGERWSLARVARTTLCGIDDPIIFDVGAHTGDYALLAKQAVPSARIFAFEPASTTFGALARRLADTGTRDITPVNIGLSDADGEADLHTYTANGECAPQLSSIPLRRPTQVVEVRITSKERIPVTTIDSFCRTEGIARIALLKLDVEGHELAVLRGASRMLDAQAVSIIQFEFGPANLYSRTYFFDFWSLLSDRFDLFRIIPKGLVPIRFYGEHQEIFLTTNYLAILKPNRGV